MSTFIEDFYYGNIEPQEVNSELTPKLKKKTNLNGYAVCRILKHEYERQFVVITICERKS